MKHALTCDMRPSVVRCLYLVGALCASLAVGVARGQEQVPEVGLAEIVVTAQHTVQTAKDVPISLSVLSGDELADRHIDDIVDATRSVPGLSFGSGGGAGLNNITIRGITSTSSAATVGVYLNDVSFTVRNGYNIGAPEIQFFDLDRIEVLRGPQGTLFGASSMGGTIRYITKQPDPNNTSLFVAGDTSYTEHGTINYQAQSVVNLPLAADTAAVRLVAGYVRDGGYIDHYAPDGSRTDSNINYSDTGMVRISGLERLPDGATIEPEFFYQNYKSGGYDLFVPALGLYRANYAVDQPGQDTLFVPSVKIEVPVADGTLTAISSYYRRLEYRTIDSTFFNSAFTAHDLLDPVYPAQAPQINGMIGSIPAPDYNNTNITQVSQEVRYASPKESLFSRPFTWIGGLYVNRQVGKFNDYEYMPGLGDAFQEIFGFPINAPQSYLGPANFPGVDFKNDVVYSMNQRTDERQYAVFAQGRLDVTDQWKLDTGIRYVRARLASDGVGSGIYYFGNQSPFSSIGHFNATTPKVALTYEVNPDTNLYASATKGFRLGGPSGPTPAIGAGICDADYRTLGITSLKPESDPDSLWTYEVGNKTALLNRHLTLDSSVYLTNWKNIQQAIVLPTCGFRYTTNIGDARVYGAETTMEALLTSQLRVSVTGGYTHAAMTESEDPATAAVGERLLYVPDWTAALGAEYSSHLTALYSPTLRLDYGLIGPSHGSYLVTDTAYNQPRYAVLNGNVSFTVESFALSLYAKNVFNDHTLIQRPTIDAVEQAITPRPRTVGLRVEKTF
jgi:iron complex outermembrane recepter protein